MLRLYLAVLLLIVQGASHFWALNQQHVAGAMCVVLGAIDLIFFCIPAV